MLIISLVNLKLIISTDGKIKSYRRDEEINPKEIKGTFKILCARESVYSELKKECNYSKFRAKLGPHCQLLKLKL